jgi:UbiD family decarboxylase
MARCEPLPGVSGNPASQQLTVDSWQASAKEQMHMAYEDLRSFIKTLEAENELLRVPMEVDWEYELAGWVRKSVDMRPKGPALLFENLKGYGPEHRVFSAGVASYPRFALALGLPKDTHPKKIIETFRQRIKKPQPPQLVKTGPVKENIIKGNDINLFKFPVPWWTPRDGGRYLGTWHGVVSKNPETGVQNTGMYRVMIYDKNHTGIGFLPFTQIGYHYSIREKQNKPLEVAVVIGAEEVVPMVAGTGFPPDCDEFGMAGALRGEPLKLVQCETVDLEVPATAEIVLEGLLLPHDRRPEGPFGEHTGYHGGPVRMRPVFRVTAICHRNNPIFRGCLLGKPTTEDHTLYDVAYSAAALDMFDTHGPQGVTGVHCPPEGDSISSMVVAMKPHFIGHSRNVGRTVLSSSVGKYMKYVVVVDDDIDPFDLGQVWWAIVTRTQGSRDIEVLKYGTTSRSDPSVPRDQPEYTDKVIIDATKKLDYPYDKNWGGHWAPTGMPIEPSMRLADMKWEKLVSGTVQYDAQIKELELKFEKEIKPHWVKWRSKAYEMTPEEQAREIARSYPVLRDSSVEEEIDRTGAVSAGQM